MTATYRRISAGILVSALTWAQVALGDDWPQWQGPARDAISKERGLLQEWPKEGPRLAWKVKGLGAGPSTPSVADGRIFGMSHQGKDEVVWAISETDGKAIWVTRLGSAFGQDRPQANEGPGGTPTVDGDRLYALGLDGTVSCVQVKDGKLVWQRSLTADFGGQVPAWSFRESPLVDGNKVIVTPGGADATLVALDKLTGKTIWKSLVPGGPGAAYASAIAFDFEGQRQYAQLTAKTLVGVAASDGKFLWRYDAPANSHGINCSTPIHLAGKVFAASPLDRADVSASGSGASAPSTGSPTPAPQPGQREEAMGTSCPQAGQVNGPPGGAHQPAGRGCSPSSKPRSTPRARTRSRTGTRTRRATRRRRALRPTRRRRALRWTRDVVRGSS
jgi:outer membrane protein assembly factor BamB